MCDEIRSLVDMAKNRRFRDLARLLTLLEQTGSRSLSNPQLLRPPNTALRVGITGPPGAGKSTLVAELIREWRRLGSTVGVLAVDPSSPFSGGAILGDRIRYSEHFNDEGVFIRSLGTRGSLGGLCASSYLMLRAYDLWGFDVVLIETVGVGQTEFDILHVADIVSLVLVPESGDSVQAMKAGLMEIADVFVINKADRPGADSLAQEIQFYFDEKGGQKEGQRLYKTVATKRKGTLELAEGLQILGKGRNTKESRLNPQRLRHEALSLLRGSWERSFRVAIEEIKTPEEMQSLVLSSEKSFPKKE